ncbi:Copper transport protein CTR2, partial [Tolypocladium ophioglossoides CBS 100239]
LLLLLLLLPPDTATTVRPGVIATTPSGASSHDMDHSHVDHVGMGHGGGGMDDMCSMSMLFTWDTTNLCIVFRQWHIRSTASLVLSLLAVILLAMGYEALRALSRRYEDSINKRVAALPRFCVPMLRPCVANRKDDETVTEITPFLASGQNQLQAGRRGHVVKAVLYAAQNFYAFMLMLVFMTYNGWVMVAVSLGAFFGYLVFGQTTPATRDNACH